MRSLLLFLRLRRIALFAIAATFAWTSFGAQQVLAIDEDFYSSERILFSNPDDICGGRAKSVQTPSIILEKSPTLELIFKELLGRGFNGVQTAAIMGNMQAESGFNSGAVETGNGIGYGLAQWSFGRRTQLEAFAVERKVPPSDIPMQIEFLAREYNQTYKSRLASTAFADGLDIPAATTAWMEMFEVPYLDPASSDPAHINSRRIPAALKVYEFYKDLSPDQRPTNRALCVNKAGVVAGDLIKTALNFALSTPATNGMTSESQAVPEYVKNKATINPSADVTDCGGFIATAMRASGVDPNYPLLGVGVQLNYVRNTPDKYQVIEGIRSTGELQPGDILYIYGHTTLYTGMSPYSSVDASLGDRVPSVRDAGSAQYMLANNAVVARLIK